MEGGDVMPLNLRKKNSSGHIGVGRGECETDSCEIDSLPNAQEQLGGPS